jgi:GDSL-like Lipase/Acylhydrolase family
VARPGRRALLLAAALVVPAAGAVGADRRPLTPQTSQTSCEAVAHIGDSISVGMESPAYLPDDDLRLEARYQAIGATDVRFDISGARSVVEHLEGQRNGAEAARRLRQNGFEGCWVVALGTNDAANVAVGSGYGYSERIDRMMEIIGDDPVLWVDVKTLRERGPYASENMRRFNSALEKAHARYPALRVFDWSDVVIDQWFVADGIHYNADGYAYRAALIADAVADNFPAGR